MFLRFDPHRSVDHGPRARFRVVPTEKRGVSLHVVYAENFYALRSEILADGERLRIASGTRFVGDRFEEGLPAVSDE